MSKPANPALVGAFVLGAIILLLAGILIFGSGKIFTDTYRVVMYFEGSLKGLNTGASVALEGVHIGTVVDMGIMVNNKDYSIHSFVIVDINRNNLRLIAEEDPAKLMKSQRIEARMVEKKGLRAQLQLESMVTGQLFIHLSFYPDAPPQKFIIDPITKLPEIPTVPSALQQMEGTVNKVLEKMGHLPLEQIVINLNDTLRGIDRLVNDRELMAVLRNFNLALENIQKLTRNLEKQVPPLMSRATETLTSVTDAAQDIGTVLHNTASTVSGVASSLQKTLATTRATLDSTQEALSSFKGMMGSNSPVGYEIVKTLQQLAEAARALRVLAESLERHPDSVIFGKPQ